MIPDWLKIYSQYGLPQHGLSRAMQRLALLHKPPGLKNFISLYSRIYGVNLAEAENSDLDAYPTFNAFFTRALKPGARPIDERPGVIVSPVDGTLSEYGEIEADQLLQAKGLNYPLITLLGGSAEWAKRFQRGAFMTIYLAPGDYHRVHMPVEGELIEYVKVPGRLFSVSPTCIRKIPRLFTRNERVISYFNTEAGLMAFILVGALNVGSIDTVWDQTLTPIPKGNISVLKPAQPVHLQRGEEMGRFNIGSTIIMLFEYNHVKWELLATQQSMRLGRAVGQVNRVQTSSENANTS